MLIAHLNTKGKFSLGPLTVRQFCVMRSWARLQQGGELKKKAMLLEHTLIMPGEIVLPKKIKQGWPANYQCNMEREKETQKKLEDQFGPEMAPPEEAREHLLSGAVNGGNPVAEMLLSP